MWPKPLSSNNYAIKDSFSFTKEALEFDASFFMAIFDMKSYFTTIPLTEALNLCKQNLYIYQLHVDNLKLYNLLKIEMFESIFFCLMESFRNSAMAQEWFLAPTLANIVFCDILTFGLENCSSHFKLFAYRQFVDNTFSFFDQRTLRNWDDISTNSIEDSNLDQKLRKMVCYHS